jgi:hypothetical protein
VKCIWAPAAIGTDNVMAVLREAAGCETVKVADAATHELARIA